MSKKKPTLKFNAGDESGFTPAGISSFRNTRSAAVVRELVQNSSDAASGVSNPARVCFLLESFPTKKIPGISEYKKAFEQAVSDQKKLQKTKELPDQAKTVVNAMSNCLDSTETEVLSVLDNGIGLNKGRMRSLLGDGISYQNDNQSTGAYGNGHMVAIPSSNLRYVLYGGVVKSGKKICSGHAIIASRFADRKNLSKDGFFILAFTNNIDRYIFPEAENIPDMILDKLKKIRTEWKWNHGTVVMIPGFNRFFTNDKDFDLWKLIARDTACSFFHAIYHKKLVVEVHSQDKKEILNHKNLEQTLKEHSNQKRARGPFLSGYRAYGAFGALKEPPRKCETSKGNVDVFFRSSNDIEMTRIDLCRNGMWISDKFPALGREHFADHEPFQCVICVDAGSGGELHRLVKKAEGPLHNELNTEPLEPAERKDLRDAFGEIREFLQKAVPKLQRDSFKLEGMLTIQGESSIAKTGSRPHIIGSPTIMRRPKPFGDTPQKTGGEPGEGGGTGKGSRKDRGGSSWSGRSLSFRASSVPTGQRSYLVRIVPSEDCQGSELRLALDENLDVTCDNLSREPFVTLINPHLDGNPVSADNLIVTAGKTVGILIGNLEKNRPYELRSDYDLPDDLAIDNNQPVVLRVEIMRRALQTRDGNG